MTSLEKTIKIVDPRGKVLAELTKILKDVTVEEFKKILVKSNLFRMSLTSFETRSYLPSAHIP